MFEELFGKCSLDISKGDVVSIDDKNLHVQYDADKIYSIHIKDKDVYERLKIATKEIIPMKSYFISKQTILLNDFEGDKN